MTTSAVFVIDDDHSVRDAIERLLRSAGFTVRTFAAARDVVAPLLSHPPACVIADVRMPELNGLDLLDVLRAVASPVPVILITGHGDTAMEDRARVAGAAALLAKPFDADALLDAIARARVGPAR